MELTNLHRFHLAAKYCNKTEALFIYKFGCSQLSLDMVGIPQKVSEVRGFIDKKLKRGIDTSAATNSRTTAVQLEDPLCLC